MEKKKRDRTVKRNPNLPTYASLKNCNQINPIAWFGVRLNEADSLCGIYTIRKLIVVSAEGVPLPAYKTVSLNEAKAACQYLRSVARGDTEENIIRANVGKEEYVRWMNTHHLDIDTHSIYSHMNNEEIDMISLYALFIEGCSSGRPALIDRVKFGAETFQHWQRGKQPVHCWIDFIDDLDNDDPALVSDDSNDIPNDKFTLIVPTNFAMPSFPHAQTAVDTDTILAFTDKLLQVEENENIL